MFVPQEYALKIRDELAEIDVGVTGNYDHCVAISQVTGYFCLLEGANPFDGKVGEIKVTTEYKLEVNVIPLANHLFGG